jgi:hypothetical protein
MPLVNAGKWEDCTNQSATGLKSDWRYKADGKGVEMEGSGKIEKNIASNSSLSKWLIWINAILIGFLMVIFLLAGMVWFSDRLMTGVMNQIINPRLNRLFQKNPEVLLDLNQSLTPESLARIINRILEKDPRWLSRFVKATDPVIVGKTLNISFKENPDQMAALLKNLDAKALADLNNQLLATNKPLFLALVGSCDRKALSGFFNELIKKNPAYFSEVLGGLLPFPLSKATNQALLKQKVFLSEFFGTLDMGSLAAIIDKVAKDHPEFMNELVDKIIELIRKDFMKSGI